MKLSRLFGTALLVGTLTVVGCGDDGGNGTDPSTFCNIGACAANETLRNLCIADVNECLRLPSGDAQSDCLALAALDQCGIVI